MISFINGKIDMVLENSVIVDNNGIGYQIHMSNLTISKLPQKGETVKLYTYMNVKEDNISLYGFISMEEIRAFNMIISVSGIGPKSALGILATITPHHLMLAIITEDVTVLSKAPGIGKKTAQRLILELKDKIKTKDALQNEVTSINTTNNINADKQDAIDALVVLGYSYNEALKTILEIADEGASLEDIIKVALKKLI